MQLQGGPEPMDGYFFQAMVFDQDGRPYVAAGPPLPKANNAPPGVCTNPARYGFAAFPGRYGSDGRESFMTSEDGVTWRKDTGGEPVPFNRTAGAPPGSDPTWSQS